MKEKKESLSLQRIKDKIRKRNRKIMTNSRMIRLRDAKLVK